MPRCNFLVINLIYREKVLFRWPRPLLISLAHRQLPNLFFYISKNFYIINSIIYVFFARSRTSCTVLPRPFWIPFGSV